MNRTRSFPLSGPLVQAAALWTLVAAGACASARDAAAVAGQEADPVAPSPRVEAREDGGTIHVTLDGAPFASLVVGGDPKPYVYPLHGPGGVPLTRSYPLREGVPNEATDHPHHVSFWFAHGDVDGFDFWHGSGRGERQVLSSHVVEEDASGVTITASYLWETEDGPLLVERRALTFGGTDERRTIDVDLTLWPAGPRTTTLGDTKEGTFALRLHPALRLKGPVATATIRNAAGQVDGACWGQQAAWVDYSGTVDGREVGVAILDHPENLRHPTWWHARDYGLFAANPFGAHDFSGAPRGSGAHTLEPGDSLRLRYRVLLHAGPGEPEALAAEWDRFAGDA